MDIFFAFSTPVRWLATVVIGMVVTGCGGSSGNILIGGEDPDRYLEWQEGVFLDKNLYQNLCAEPRSGPNPFDNNRPYPDQAGSTVHENFFLRSWTNDLYLWYDEVQDRDPYEFSTAAYFALLKSEQTTSTGAAKDNFHFSQNTFDYNTRTVSGESFGYGMELVFPVGEAIVRDVIPGSPAALLGVTRGMQIVEADGVDVTFMTTQAQINAISAALFTDSVGEQHSFVFESLASGEQLAGSLTSALVTSVPVSAVSIIETATGSVGYMVFKAHTQPSEKALFDAFSTLAAQGVEDLVLDLRYNGGGLLAVAAEVAYMIAGAEMTSGETFFQLAFNDKHPSIDPVTGSRLNPLPFISRSVGFSSELLAADIALPSLGLNRVFILSSASTCSASEAIINGLRGVDVEVIQVGSTTCGKPYGFYPQDNCGTTYLSIQFAGNNAKGFGEYSSGFSPTAEPGAVGVPLPGCYVEDDLTRLLGDASEAMLAAALQYLEQGTCPSLVAIKPRLKRHESFKTAAPPLQVQPPASPGIENAILLK